MDTKQFINLLQPFYELRKYVFFLLYNQTVFDNGAKWNRKWPYVSWNVTWYCVCSTDAILIPSPFYGVITEDVGLYSSVKLHHVPLYSQVVNESPVVIFHNVTLAFYSGFLLFYFCFL